MPRCRVPQSWRDGWLRRRHRTRRRRGQGLHRIPLRAAALKPRLTSKSRPLACSPDCKWLARMPNHSATRSICRTSKCRAESARTAPVVEAPPPIDLVPAGPRVSVAGIAEEQLDGRVERTAILSSPMGVLLVHEGDTVLDDYRVGRIEAESVELVRLSDGTSTQLTFGAPQ